MVCLGNICRSPVAEVVLTARLADEGLADRVEVTSSGTGTWHLGEAMDPRAASTLTTAGYDGSRHAAAKFDPGSLSGLDLVLAMDGSNLTDIRATVADLTDADAERSGCSVTSTPTNRAATCPTRSMVGTPASRRC